MELKATRSYKRGKYEEALKETFAKMDELLKTDEGKDRLAEIRAESMDEGAYTDPFSRTFGKDTEIAQYCGCTATVILITSDKVFCANAGDSRTVYVD